MALKDIKNKIRATDRTRKVTKAMEAVSAVKMRKSQERALLNRGYAEAALRILSRIRTTPDIAKSAYITKSGSRECIVIMTSDKGLAGNLNGAVLKLVENYTKGKDPSSIVAICLGRKGYEYALRKGFDVLHFAVHQYDISDPRRRCSQYEFGSDCVCAHRITRHTAAGEFVARCPEDRYGWRYYRLALRS